MAFQRAERRKAKLRLGLAGVAGSGKSYSALKIAFGIGGKIAVIDTENHSADLYAHLGEYDVCTIDAPYTIQKYLTALKEAESLGYTTIIIDSLSHAWAGEGGLLDQKGAIEKRGGSGWAAWRDITPLHNKLVESMLQSKCHIIATLRSKMEHIQQKDEKTGKTKVEKVGMGTIQREGMDFEFTVMFDLDQYHVASSTKDRTSLFDGMYFTPDESTGAKLLQWLETGADDIPAPPTPPPGGPPDGWEDAREQAVALQGMGRMMKEHSIPAEDALKLVVEVLGREVGAKDLTKDEFMRLVDALDAYQKAKQENTEVPE